MDVSFQIPISDIPQRLASLEHRISVYTLQNITLHTTV